MSVEQSLSRDTEGAQKHVTKRISYWADSRAGRIVEVYMSSAFPTLKSTREVSAGLNRVQELSPQK